MRIEQRLLQELETLSACESSRWISLTSVGAPRARSDVLTAAILAVFFRRRRCAAPPTGSEDVQAPLCSCRATTSSA
jgi:hypothetical protein